VSCDGFALSLACKYGFEVIADHKNNGETDAIEMATRVCQMRGVDTLVIPGDVPLIQAWEMQAIVDAAPEVGSVLVPAGDGRGTNAVLRRPAALFPLRFGNDSFKPHLAAAQASGESCVVLRLPGIAVDVDSPADLRQLIDLPGERRAQRLARQWDLRDYPLAANE
jgi:2-phospho-L-lactate guanylyltransferase